MAESVPWIKELLDQWALTPNVPLEYVPIFISRFFADENVQVMNCEQRGAYVQLLMRGWQQQPPSSIPDDDTKLARWADISAKKWKGMREVVLKPFTLGHDGRFYQKRLARTWVEMARKYMGRKKGADRANEVIAEKRSAGAERDAERTLDERTNVLTLPNPLIEQIDPTQPTAPHATGGVGDGDLKSSRVGEGVGTANGNMGQAFRKSAANAGVTSHPRDSDDDRMGKVMPLLRDLGLHPAKYSELLHRRDVTYERIAPIIEDIRKDPKVDEVGAVFVFRLDGKKSDKP